MPKRIDLSGHKFGKLYVECADHQEKDYQTVWKCRCDCGNVIFVRGHDLTRGHTKSCGCARATASQFRFKDLTGQKFGHLTVIGFDHKDANYKSYFKTICDCGKETIVQGYKLTSGSIKSCGCCKYEGIIKVHTTHNMTGSRLYKIWNGVKARCLNKRDKVYSLYGGRGIIICNEWLDFQNFYEWAMSNGYDDTALKGQCTIDRIDNNKGYSPENCRWVNMTVQCNNTRRNVIVEYNGEKLTIGELSAKYGVPYKLLHKRIRTFKWSVRDAVEMPKQRGV